MHYPTSWSGTQKSTAVMERLAHEITPQVAFVSVSTDLSTALSAQTSSYRNRIAVTVCKIHIPAHGYPVPDDTRSPTIVAISADLPAVCSAPVFQQVVVQ